MFLKLDIMYKQNCMHLKKKINNQQYPKLKIFLEVAIVVIVHSVHNLFLRKEVKAFQTRDLKL